MAITLSRKDETVNAVRAALKAIPFFGGTLEQFIFGRLDELRMKRIELTLTEVAQTLEQSGRKPQVDSEQFVNLLENVAPHLVRATRNENRERFRDLLSNASTLPPDAPEWEKANLAGQLLSELETPALAVVACLARFTGPQPAGIVSLPKPQVVSQNDFLWESPSLGPFVIDFDWPVVEEWIQRLRERRLLGFSSVDARGGFGGLYLTELGKMLVEWSVGERSAT
jgi:hypothetical protein